MRVTRVERTGSEIFAFVEPVDLLPGVTARGDSVVVRLDKREDVQAGHELVLCVHVDEVLVFDADGEALR